MSDTKTKIVIKTKPQKLTVDFKRKSQYVTPLPAPSNLKFCHMVKHNDSNYLVSGLEFHDKIIPIVTDADQYSLLEACKWRYIDSGGYIAYDHYADGKQFIKYLHNLVMNRDFHRGKGQRQSIDHINRIGSDNRKCNLELKTQTDQNHNKKKVKRNVKLPDGCGIDKDKIPTYIVYNHNHGDDCYFSIELKKDGKRIFYKKTTKRGAISIPEKLDQAKLILKQAMNDNPKWFEGKCMNGDLSDEGLIVAKSYFEILRTANVIDPINDEETLLKRNTKYLLNTKTEKIIPAKEEPESTEIPTPLPRYIRYAKATKTRGDGFIFEKRTDAGRISINSRGGIHLKHKYNILLHKIAEKGIILT